MQVSKNAVTSHELCFDVFIGYPQTERVVFPKLLRERSEDGKHIVVIDKSLTLELEKATVLADHVLISGFGEEVSPPELVIEILL